MQLRSAQWNGRDKPVEVIQTGECRAARFAAPGICGCNTARNGLRTDGHRTVREFLGTDSKTLLTATTSALAIATLLSGSMMALLGALRFGRFVQFLPYSLMGGYFAAVGWLLLLGGLSTLTTLPDSRESLEAFLAELRYSYWAPSVALAIWLLLGRHLIRSNWFLPVSLLGATFGWYAVISLVGMTPDVAMDRGYLVGPLEEAEGLFHMTFQYPGNIFNPELVFNNRGSMASIFIISVLSLLVQWLIEGRRRFSTLEYLVIPAILFTSVALGFVEGVFIGLVTAMALFAVKYSRIRSIRYVGSGNDFMSNVDRCQSDQEYLQSRGATLMIIALQGYLFFGTLGRAFKTLRKRMRKRDQEQLRFLILNLSQVTGMHASAEMNFHKVAFQAASGNLWLILTSVEPEILGQLEMEELARETDGRIQVHEDLDHAVEWVEERLLKNREGHTQAEGCFQQIAEYLSPDEIVIFKSYLEQRQVNAGNVLAHQGDLSRELYFLEDCAAPA